MDILTYALAILFSVTLLAVAGPWFRRAVSAQRPLAANATVVAAATGSTRAEVEAKLRRLASSPPPAAKQEGAMCYEPRAFHDHADYVCPKCGARTQYGQAMAEEVLAIEYVRQRVRQIKGLDLTLDEHEFCKKCSRGPATDPALTLVVRYRDPKTGKTVEHRTRGVSSTDIQLIEELLSGSLDHNVDGPDTEPLQKHLERLQQLLGVTVKG